MNTSRPHDGPHRERGIALISALLIVVLLSVVGAAFMMSTTGERGISRNVHMSRAALLSADAGVRTAQQVLANIAKSKLDSLVTLWNGTGAIITAPSTLFPAGATSVSSTNPHFSASATIAWADSDLTPGTQVYNYRYTVTSTGTSGTYGERQVQSTGILRVSAERGTFADYLMFTNIHLMPGNGTIWFTSSSQFDGRVHTNGEFRFGFQPGFQDQVTSVNSKAWYYNNGNPVELNANANGTIDVPDFFGGFQRSSSSITLPSNAYDQQAAALGLAPPAGVAPTNSQINTAIGSGAGSGTPPNGIYVVQSGGAMKGGLYVQGDLDSYTMTADTVNHRQNYVMRQGSTTKTIVIDQGANTTSVTVGSTTTTYTGVPRGVTYVNGNITSLKGPARASGEVVPALEASNQVLVAASGDVVIQGDITCENYDTSQNVLGIYSATGDVRVGSSAPNDCYLDAFVMAPGSSGCFTVDNYNSGSPRGTFHLRGGAITQYYGAFFTFNSNGVLQTGYNRDFHYDRRGLVPPYFPTTTRFNANQPSARTLAWKEI